VIFTTAAQLLLDLGSPRFFPRLDARLKHYAGVGLLVVDELGYLLRRSQLPTCLFQLVSLRYEKKSLSSPRIRSFSQWPTIFPTRLRHGPHRTRRPSLRHRRHRGRQRPPSRSRAPLSPARPFTGPDSKRGSLMFSKINHGSRAALCCQPGEPALQRPLGTCVALLAAATRLDCACSAAKSTTTSRYTRPSEEPPATAAARACDTRRLPQQQRVPQSERLAGAPPPRRPSACVIVRHVQRPAAGRALSAATSDASARPVAPAARSPPLSPRNQPTLSASWSANRRRLPSEAFRKFSRGFVFLPLQTNSIRIGDGAPLSRALSGRAPLVRSYSLDGRDTFPRSTISSRDGRSLGTRVRSSPSGIHTLAVYARASPYPPRQPACAGFCLGACSLPGSTLASLFPSVRSFAFAAVTSDGIGCPALARRYYDLCWTSRPPGSASPFRRARDLPGKGSRLSPHDRRIYAAELGHESFAVAGRSPCSASPRIRFLFVGPQFAPRFFQPQPRGRTLRFARGRVPASAEGFRLQVVPMPGTQARKPAMRRGLRIDSVGTQRTTRASGQRLNLEDFEDVVG